MKIHPANIWFPNYPYIPGHNSTYYNRITDGAMRGIVNLGNPDPNRINSGALRHRVEPAMAPSCVIHIKRKQV